MFVSGFPSRSLSLIPTTASLISFPSFPLPASLAASHSQIQFKSARNEPALPRLSLLPAVSLCTCQTLLFSQCLFSSLALGVVRLDAEEEENPSGGAQLGGAARPGRKSACGTGLGIFHWNSRNPDVCASFIRKEFVPNAHTLHNNTHREFRLEEVCVKLWKFQ